MKLHKTTIDRVLRVFDMWGGRSSNDKLVEAINALDFQVYTQQNGKSVLVLTEELEQQKTILEQQKREYIR